MTANEAGSRMSAATLVILCLVSALVSGVGIVGLLSTTLGSFHQEAVEQARSYLEIERIGRQEELTELEQETQEKLGRVDTGTTEQQLADQSDIVTRIADAEEERANASREAVALQAEISRIMTDLQTLEDQVEKAESLARQARLAIVATARQIVTARARKAALVDRMPESITNSLGMTFDLVRPAARWDGKREYRLDQPIYVNRHSVTNLHWNRVTGTITPSEIKSPEFPVIGAGELQVAEFCRALGNQRREREAGRVYRPLKAAEWAVWQRGRRVAAQEIWFGLEPMEATVGQGGMFSVGSGSTKVSNSDED